MSRPLRIVSLFLAVICMVMAGPTAVLAGTAHLKALIVTGQNNHNWRTSSPILKQILQDTGLFSVDTAVSPGKGGDMTGFMPDFASYDVVVLDYNGDSWHPGAKKSFEHYVKNGGGVVVYHAANNAFPGWPEYNEIIGLGGWEDRDEKSGPYLYWKGGAIVRDTTPGIGGYHGMQHDFQVINRDLSHPITRGLPGKWMHAKDELYSLLRGPAKNIHVLATAYSAVEQRGTGRHEPVIFTVTYGKGRIFHTVLGHAMDEYPPPALECAGFIVTFGRGAEWAASGRVTLEIPGDFPATTKEVSAPEDVRRWKGFRPPSFEKILSAAAAYRFGQDTAPLAELECYIRANLDSPAAMRRCEHLLLEFLESAAAEDAKQFVCRQLRLMSTERSVPLLVRMARHEATCDMARYALEKIPGKEIDRALTDILPQTTGKVKTGIIHTLGRRGNPAAFSILAKFMKDTDENTAAAAVTALGNIADPKAIGALSRVLEHGPERQESLLADALLKCAETLVSRNRLKAAGRIYKKLGKTCQSPALRSAALKGRIACSGEKAGKIILDVLSSKQTGLHAAAVSRVFQVNDEKTIEALCERLPELTADISVQLLFALGGKESSHVRAAVLEAAHSPVEDIRITALQVLEQQGNDSTVYLLAQRAAAAKGREQETARAVLRRLKGDGVNRDIILNLVKRRDAALQAELLQAVAVRRIIAAKSIVFAKAAYGRPGNRHLALKVLKEIAEPEDLPGLFDILTKENNETDRKETETTTAAVLAKIAEKTKCCETLLAALKEEKNVAAQCSLLRILGKTGCNNGLPTLRQNLMDESEQVRDTALRVLADWPHPAAADDLLDIAKSSENTVYHVLALQGYIRLLQADLYRSPQSAARCFKEALSIARRPEEKKTLLGALPLFPSQEALKLAESCIKDKNLAAEAQKAAEKIKASLQK